MKVIPGDLLEHVRFACVDRHVIADGIRQRFRAFAIDQDTAQPIAGPNGPFDHDVTLSDEKAGHVPVGLLPLLAKDVIPQALEHFDTRVVGIANDVAHTTPSSS